MGWVSLLLMILQYGPTIFKLVKEIIDLIKKNKGSGFQEQEAFTVELKRGLEEFKRTKDTRPLEELRERLRSRRSQSAGG
jgi:hypothetical protein